MPGRALVLVNHRSRSGRADLAAGLTRLREAGFEPVEAKLERPQQIPDLIRQHRHAVDCVIIGGGDGSLNAAASALVETGLPLGIFPLGTANDLARTLHIPVDVESAGGVVAAGHLHRIDLGSVNGHYFFNVASIGLGVEVTHRLSPDLKRRWGAICYARGLLAAVKSFQPFRADIVCDGRRSQVRSIQVAVGNGRFYGGGMTVGEDASIDDCRFFLYSVEPHDWWDRLRLAPALRSGRFDERHPVHLEQGREIEIVTRRPMAVVADGELVSRTPARFRMLAGAVQVFVPADYLDRRQEARNDVSEKRFAARAQRA